MKGDRTMEIYEGLSLLSTIVVWISAILILVGLLIILKRKIKPEKIDFPLWVDNEAEEKEPKEEVKKKKELTLEETEKLSKFTDEFFSIMDETAKQEGGFQKKIDESLILKLFFSWKFFIPRKVARFDSGKGIILKDKKRERWPIFQKWLSALELNIANIVRKLVEAKVKKKDWEESSFFEDNLSSLKDRIKACYKEINQKKKILDLLISVDKEDAGKEESANGEGAEKANTDKKNNPGEDENGKTKAEIEKEIEALEKTVDSLEKEFKQEKSKFEDKHISSIKVDELEKNLRKLILQREGMLTIFLAWFHWYLWTFVLFLGIGVAGFIFAPEKISNPFFIFFSLTFLPFVSVNTAVIVAGYNPVPHMQEWIIEFWGELLTVWEPGPHFRFPFFMRIKEGGKVYKGTLKRTLSMTREKEKGKEGIIEYSGDGVYVEDQLEFTDATAGVVTEIFIRIYDVISAVYNIEDVVTSVCAKMGSGLRAYFGGKGIDIGIEERADVNLRSIIVQHATEAAVFKEWGVEVVSMAVKGLKLSEEDEKLRRKKLAALKEKEVSEIELITANNRGRARGNELLRLADVTGITIREAIVYDIKIQQFQAWQKAGTLFASDTGGKEAGERALGEMAMLAGAAAGTAVKEVSSPKEKSPKKPEKK